MHKSEIETARGYLRVLEELESDLGSFKEKKYLQYCVLSFGRELKAYTGKQSHTRNEILSQETRAAIAALIEADYNTRIAALKGALEALGVDIN